MGDVLPLQISDIDEAARVFQQGLHREVPRGHEPLPLIRSNLRKYVCFVFKENGKIEGLVWFKQMRNHITLEFICSRKLRRGIGYKLMLSVVKYAAQRKISRIWSGVSLRDKRASEFYHSLGFRNQKKTGHFGYYIKASTEDILKLASKNASDFLKTVTGITIAAPKVVFSTKVRDAAWYGHGKININPNYNPENLTYEEMIAHEFFHHAQTKLHTEYDENIWESSAMFFAAACVTKSKSSNKIINYLNEKEHIPKGGNDRVLFIFKQNNYDVKKTLLHLL